MSAWWLLLIVPAALALGGTVTLGVFLLDWLKELDR